MNNNIGAGSNLGFRVVTRPQEVLDGDYFVEEVKAVTDAQLLTRNKLAIPENLDKKELDPLEGVAFYFKLRPKEMCNAFTKDLKEYSGLIKNELITKLKSEKNITKEQIDFLEIFLKRVNPQKKGKVLLEEFIEEAKKKNSALAILLEKNQKIQLIIKGILKNESIPRKQVLLKMELQKISDTYQQFAHLNSFKIIWMRLLYNIHNLEMATKEQGILGILNVITLYSRKVLDSYDLKEKDKIFILKKIKEYKEVVANIKDNPKIRPYVEKIISDLKLLKTPLNFPPSRIFLLSSFFTAKTCLDFSKEVLDLIKMVPTEWKMASVHVVIMNKKVVEKCREDKRIKSGSLEEIEKNHRLIEKTAAMVGAILVKNSSEIVTCYCLRKQKVLPLASLTENLNKLEEYYRAVKNVLPKKKEGLAQEFAKVSHIMLTHSLDNAIRICSHSQQILEDLKKGLPKEKELVKEILKGRIQSNFFTAGESLLLAVAEEAGRISDKLSFDGYANLRNFCTIFSHNISKLKFYNEKFSVSAFSEEEIRDKIRELRVLFNACKVFINELKKMQPSSSVNFFEKANNIFIETCNYGFFQLFCSPLDWKEGDNFSDDETSSIKRMARNFFSFVRSDTGRRATKKLSKTALAGEETCRSLLKTTSLIEKNLLEDLLFFEYCRYYRINDDGTKGYIELLGEGDVFDQKEKSSCFYSLERHIHTANILKRYFSVLDLDSEEEKKPSNYKKKQSTPLKKELTAPVVEAPLLSVEGKDEGVEKALASMRQQCINIEVHLGRENRMGEERQRQMHSHLKELRWHLALLSEFFRGEPSGGWNVKQALFSVAVAVEQALKLALRYHDKAACKEEKNLLAKHDHKELLNLLVKVLPPDLSRAFFSIDGDVVDQMSSFIAIKYRYLTNHSWLEDETDKLKVFFAGLDALQTIIDSIDVENISNVAMAETRTPLQSFLVSKEGKGGDSDIKELLSTFLSQAISATKELVDNEKRLLEIDRSEGYDSWNKRMWNHNFYLHSCYANIKALKELVEDKDKTRWPAGYSSAVLLRGAAFLESILLALSIKLPLEDKSKKGNHKVFELVENNNNGSEKEGEQQLLQLKNSHRLSEFLNGIVLWLEGNKGASPAELKSLKKLGEEIGRWEELIKEGYRYPAESNDGFCKEVKRFQALSSTYRNIVTEEISLGEKKEYTDRLQIKEGELSAAFEEIIALNIEERLFRPLLSLIEQCSVLLSLMKK